MAEQSLTLFDWHAPVKVLAFPLSRRLGKIRRVADLLERKHGADAETYWRTTVRGLSDQLSRAGVGGVDISREIEEFSAAVQVELRRRAYRGSLPTGGGAA